jgi:hypothetical protein
MMMPLLVTLALAHTPAHVLPGVPFAIAKPEFSYALFGEFVSGEERFVITLEHPVRFGTPVELFVPHRAELIDHRPAWALVGPGLPAPTAAELAALPAPLPAGWGALVELDPGTPRTAFFESVMRRFFWSTGPLAVIFPAGPSELWVWSPAHTVGKFGLGYGVEEGGGYTDAFKDWAFYAY